MKRKFRLNRETLRNLDDQAMQEVKGGLTRAVGCVYSLQKTCEYSCNGTCNYTCLVCP